MIRGIFPCLKNSLKTSFEMAVYDFQAINIPITESIQQHGALFSASAETSLWRNLPGCTARILLSVDKLWEPDYWIFTTQEQAFSPTQFQGPKLQFSLKFKYKRYPQAWNTICFCQTHQTQEPSVQWHKTEMTEAPLWMLWCYKPLNTVGSTAQEISESQDGVLLPVSVCASGHLKSLFVNKDIQRWKRKQVFLYFFPVIMGPWEVIQKFYYQYRQWWGSSHEPFKMPSINQDGAICWREGQFKLSRYSSFLVGCG